MARGVIGNTPDFGSGILGSSPSGPVWRWVYRWSIPPFAGSALRAATDCLSEKTLNPQFVSRGLNRSGQSKTDGRMVGSGEV